ncbi:undecaprenyl/decaprenyl-phosphate alpha-N-acetylglucosaminyl 1-phosphate transferase [Patescibacteria group bacterium]|nr:undecaprenyl/decaprenyl-phosphate alpha-N-acetylglucosaminyl 1-phosphate transferase [Patescibacteria group bacterium]
MINYIWPFILTLSFSLLLTPVCSYIARRLGVVDRSDIEDRKKHKRDVAYLGGVAIFVSLLLAMGFFYSELVDMKLIILGMGVVVMMGTVDDMYNLKPWQKLLFQILVGLLLVAGGVGVHSVAIPWVGDISLDGWMIDGFWGMEIGVSVFSAIFTVLWTVFLMNAMNFLDGVDGLAGGVSAIAVVILFCLSLTIYVNQPMTGLLSVLLLAAVLGFLAYNFPPATIFLGDSGSYLLGYMLAVLSIFAGGKIATLTLVLGVVILDTLFVIIGRIREGKKIWVADRMHLHFRLLDSGWNQWQVLLFYYMISIILGLISLVLSNILAKVVIWLFLVLCFVLFFYIYVLKGAKKSE